MEKHTHERRISMINQTTLKTIRTANVSQLNEIISEVKARQRSLQAEVALNFYKGQKVSFASRTGELVEGNIEKVNQKTIKVRQTNGRNVLWTVSPSLLKAA